MAGKEPKRMEDYFLCRRTLPVFPITYITSSFGSVPFKKDVLTSFP
jgi:hypothetical protein